MAHTALIEILWSEVQEVARKQESASTDIDTGTEAGGMLMEILAHKRQLLHERIQIVEKLDITGVTQSMLESKWHYATTGYAKSRIYQQQQASEILVQWRAITGGTGSPQTRVMRIHT